MWWRFRRCGRTSFRRRKSPAREVKFCRLDGRLDAPRAGRSISKSCSRPATRAPKPSSSPRPATPRDGSCRPTSSARCWSSAARAASRSSATRCTARWSMTAAPHAPSFLQVAEPDDNVFVVNSFSKPWAMTGWRIGWLVHPAYLADQMNVLAMANNTGATTFAQWGAVAALSPQGDAFRAFLLERCRKGYDVTRSFVERQNRIRWIAPQGAFYGFLHVDGMRDSFEFAMRSRAQGAGRRGARLSLCAAGRCRDQFLYPHLLCAGRRATADGSGSPQRGSRGAVVQATLLRN